MRPSHPSHLIICRTIHISYPPSLLSSSLLPSPCSSSRPFKGNFLSGHFQLRACEALIDEIVSNDAIFPNDQCERQLKDHYFWWKNTVFYFHIWDITSGTVFTRVYYWLVQTSAFVFFVWWSCRIIFLSNSWEEFCKRKILLKCSEYW